MKFKNFTLALLLAPLLAGHAFANSNLPDQAARRTRILQELGLENSQRAIKALEDRKAEEDKGAGTRQSERERLEAARKTDEDKISRQTPPQSKPEAAPAAERKPAETAKAAAPIKSKALASLPEVKRPAPVQESAVAVDSQDLSRYPVAPPPDDEDEPSRHSASPAVAYGKLLSTGPRGKPYVAFTFDDGPGQTTRQILHLFAFFRCKATFFMLGDSLESYPDLAREVAGAGHLVGNHTWSHTNFYTVYDPEKLENEIIKTYAEIQLVTGKKPYLLRIPYGVSKKWARNSAAKAEHLLVNWTYGVDTRLEKTQEEMLAEYKANLRPGAIFLFHDGGRHKPKTVWVVERLLEECRRRGLKPVTLDKMFDIAPEKFPRPVVVSPVGKKPAYAGRPI